MDSFFQEDLVNELENTATCNNCGLVMSKQEAIKKEWFGVELIFCSTCDLGR